MKITRSVKARGTVAAVSAIVFAAMFGGSAPVRADGDSEQSLIQRGFEIAPVPLNLAGKNRDLVGLGSFLVNAVADCNGCHTGGQPPNFNYAAGGNPYFGQPKKVDPKTYLAGGQDFGPAGAGPGYVGPDIISRNLTPDKTGRPEGGRSLSEFMTILRTGKDFDHLHPTCSKVTPAPSPPNCIPLPVDGELLQVMPWPVFQSMTDHEIEAIYEYLSAIPCIEGPPDPKNPLHNDCQ